MGKHRLIPCPHCSNLMHKTSEMCLSCYKKFRAREMERKKDSPFWRPSHKLVPCPLCGGPKYTGDRERIYQNCFACYLALRRSKDFCKWCGTKIRPGEELCLNCLNLLGESVIVTCLRCGKGFRTLKTWDDLYPGLLNKPRYFFCGECFKLMGSENAKETEEAEV